MAFRGMWIRTTSFIRIPTPKILLPMWTGNKRMLFVNGEESVCQLKPSGKNLRGERAGIFGHGETRLTVKKAAILFYHASKILPVKWDIIQEMSLRMAFMIWRETYGSGFQTGMMQAITKVRRIKTLKVPMAVSIKCCVVGLGMIAIPTPPGVQIVSTAIQRSGIMATVSGVRAETVYFMAGKIALSDISLPRGQKTQTLSGFLRNRGACAPDEIVCPLRIFLSGHKILQLNRRQTAPSA